jgi:hypothetical protein
MAVAYPPNTTASSQTAARHCTACRGPVGAHWAIAAAHEVGLSIREISAATGLSPTRVQHLFTSEDAGAIPVRLSRLRDLELPPPARRLDALAGAVHPLDLERLTMTDGIPPSDASSPASS